METKKLTAVDLDAYINYISDLQERIEELENILRQFGPISTPLMVIWDTAHSTFYAAGDNVEVKRLVQEIAQEVDKAQKCMCEVLKKKMAKVIGVGHLFLNDKKVRLEFHSDGKVFMGDSNDTRTSEYKGEPLLVESLLVFDFNLFEKQFSAWDD